VRLTPLDENSPLDSSQADGFKREYARVCHELSAGADCLLSGTNWNMEMHGRRMADELFRLITF
jgi:hypothetical protein